MLDYELMLFFYVMASLCVVYKLAYFVRQSAFVQGSLIQPLRWMAVLIGTGVIYRVIQVTDSKAWVEMFDAVSQIMWCVILYLLILMIGRKKRAW